MLQPRIERMLDEVQFALNTKLVVGICAGTLALVLAALLSPDVPAGESESLSQTPAPQASTPQTSVAPAPTSAPTGDFIYFPGQYVNQATEATEHVQAY